MIMLAPVNLPLGVVSDALAIRRKAGSVAHVRPRSPGHPDINADHVKQSHEVFAPLTAEQNAASVGCPSQHRVVSRVRGQLLRRATTRGNDKDIEVPIAVARESDPLAVRRETRISIARFVNGQPLYVAAILIGRPDVAEIREGNA